MKWEFTQAEILYAWQQIRWDRIPAPITIAPPVTLQPEWEAVERELSARLPVLNDPDLLPVLRTAADPDMSVIMTGTRKHPIRAYGAVTTTIGVTMIQRPSPDPARGGNILIEVGRPKLIAKVFTAVAGARPAGRLPSMVESWDRMCDGQPASWMVRDEPLVVDRMHDLLTAPRTGHGHIEIQLDRHETRRRKPRYMSWFDVERDGRYVYGRRHGDLHIDPCNPEQFQKSIVRLMGL
ncbi:ESX secretion-associated protein EspG [Nocardia macrotermitis]|uniref:ESAT-6 protein secretion system EspG family protein n=1 Tax=Nocardia macrotermitis TaxID=2585198 RepID=A0A7K0DHV1_9NOCA|nr:ESX secretion-associated protein EspG [Nocardia macrotermitis]MQY24374.1 hypothetical protein [Nocardia macrotermitis]